MTKEIKPRQTPHGSQTRASRISYIEEKKRISDTLSQYVKDNSFEESVDFYYKISSHSVEDCIELALNIILKEGEYIEPEFIDNVFIRVWNDGNAIVLDKINKFISISKDNAVTKIFQMLKDDILRKYKLLGINIL